MTSELDSEIESEGGDYMEQFELDKNGIPIIKRQYVKVPPEIRVEFVADMYQQVRKAPDLIESILVKHYRERAMKKMIKQSSGQPQAENRIPTFVTKRLPVIAEQDKPQNADR